MKILITGSSGFIGKHVVKALKNESITTLARTNANIICNLYKEIPLLPQVDLVVHIAGKAHKSLSKSDEHQFFDVNVTGTKNLLSGLEQSADLPKTFVFISSISVYGLEEGISIKENYSLNANKAYGLSKKEAEGIVQSWCDRNKIKCSILRLPLVIGLDPPGNLRSMINAINNGYYMNIDGGLAKRSMVMANDVANCILRVSEVGGIYNLTDGYHPSFKELSELIAKQLNKKKPKNIPLWFANVLAWIGDICGDNSPFNSYKLSKTRSNLIFDDSKARNTFGWNPTSVLDSFKLR